MKPFLKKSETILLASYFAKWTALCLVIGLAVGTAGAGFLISLNWMSETRQINSWLVYLLPLGGFIVGLIYHYFGKRSEKGNNLIIEEINHPKKRIPFLMGPLVVLGTLVTHLFGGSAGREGTAVQLGASLSDQLSYLFKLKDRDRKVVIICGVSAGFAAVFSTPIAGAIFALEVFLIGSLRYRALLPSLLSAVLAKHVTDLWLHYFDVAHAHYHIASEIIPEMNVVNLLLSIVAGICFGLAARSFSLLTQFIGTIYTKTLKYKPLRPLVGGLIVAALILGFRLFDFAGLGIPFIQDTFHHQRNWYDFMIKLVLTALTLGAGYKGGEVTPLFFIGAALGSALFLIIPQDTLPMALLAGMGFVAVFAGAANTPIASAIMGIELFGATGGVYFAIACVVSYICSGKTGIYGSQMIGVSKHAIWKRTEGKLLKPF